MATTRITLTVFMWITTFCSPYLEGWKWWAAFGCMIIALILIIKLPEDGKGKI